MGNCIGGKIQEDEATVSEDELIIERYKPAMLRMGVPDDGTIEEILLGVDDPLALVNLTEAEANNSATLVYRLYELGATSDQITYLLNIQSDAQVLTTQIESEANQAASLIHQLYSLGVTSGQITALLAHENNAQVLHDQVNGEASNSAAGILQLYADGATSAEITYMLTRQSNAQVLSTQIQAEANQTARLIYRLYFLGVTSEQVTNLLAQEDDAQVLYDQVNGEASRGGGKILQLYTDGATSEEITGLLTAEPDADLLHDYMTKVNPVYTIGNLLYASGSGGKIGSIYFDDGRIRLVHDKHPEISKPKSSISRYTISNDDYDKYKTWVSGTAEVELSRYIESGALRSVVTSRSRMRSGIEYYKVQLKRINKKYYMTKGDLRTYIDWKKNSDYGFTGKYRFVMALSSCQEAVIGQGERLFEFFGADGTEGNHPSRGAPVKFEYIKKQIHLNIIYNAIDDGANNSRLKAIMSAHPTLKNIPMN